MRETNLRDRYDFIRLHPSSGRYAKAAEAPEIPMGHSRIGGPIIDLPPDFEHPADLYFIAQLDLAWLTHETKQKLLPDHGFLFFFYNCLITDDVREVGLVHYFPGTSQQLRRIVREHESWFWEGTTLTECTIAQEELKSRFDDEGWKYFEGMGKTKIDGLPSNPQWCDDEIEEALDNGKKMLLLQVGEDVTNEGCLHFFIKRSDLVGRNFDSCDAVWGQT